MRTENIPSVRQSTCSAVSLRRRLQKKIRRFIILSESGSEVIPSMEKIELRKYDFSTVIEDPQKKLVLIIYDIIDNKRRTRMVKHLESYGSRVQKSDFEALLPSGKYHAMINGITKIIDNEDNVRIYRLNSSNEVVLLGTVDTVYEENVIII